MKRTFFFAFLLSLGMISCQKSDNYQLTSEVSAVWNKDSGELKFSPLKEGIRIRREFRKELDTVDTDVVLVDKTGNYTFQLIENNQLIGNKIGFTRLIHKGIPATVTYNSPDSPHNGIGKLNDGIGSTVGYDQGEWVGWKNKDAVIELDFNGDQPINYIAFRYKDDIENNIFPPKTLKLEVTADGTIWQHLITRDVAAPGLPITIEQFFVRGTYKKARITVGNHSTGNNIKSWLLIDEVSVSER